MANNEFGDFQTNQKLARRVTALLGDLTGSPATVVEPTCGEGNFVQAALDAYPDAIVHGLEINEDYARKLEKRFQFNPHVILHNEDYFDFDWDGMIGRMAKPVWVIGNPPWVTNTQLVKLESKNLPKKSPQAHLKGIEAQTGKSNFDISESMIRDWFRWCAACEGSLAVICKTSVARKLLQWWWKSNAPAPDARIHMIDAKAEFDVTVSACVLVCTFASKQASKTCDVYADLDSKQPKSNFGQIGNVLVSDAPTYKKHIGWIGSSSGQPQWRSGIKHDAGGVLEFQIRYEKLIRKDGTCADLPDDYVYPLIKGSDLAQHNPMSRARRILVPQSYIGENTDSIAKKSPKTWNYLNGCAEAFDKRKSVIYKKGSRFSIFGIGEYSFKPWKIAIAALYKSLNFRIIGPVDGKPVMFDDTVYFVGFDTRAEAESVMKKLNDADVQRFLSSMIFWDDMRPVKTEILNRLNLSAIQLKEAA
jgi:hypothetical protein